MIKLLPLAAALWMVSFTNAPPGKFHSVDLQPYANHKFKEDFGQGLGDNNLAGLLEGGRTYGGVNCKLADGVVQLNSPNLQKPKPEKVEGIKVNKTCDKLHILHATQYSIDDDSKIAEYIIRYEDGKTESIPVVYGQDVRDWWFPEDAKGVTRGKVAWKGDNERAKSFSNRLRLYLTTWDNPHPAKKIATIDYVKTPGTDTAPFCVAITLESK